MFQAKSLRNREHYHYLSINDAIIIQNSSFTWHGDILLSKRSETKRFVQRACPSRYKYTLQYNKKGYTLKNEPSKERERAKQALGGLGGRGVHVESTRVEGR